ncbi:TPA: DUF551 domain-containing protein [Yersinia enterocolitica]|nr:DUF551 domain-containing protein [Yersinia enterocolitica]
MKELNSFTVERLGEIKNAFLDCHKETAPSIGEIFALIDIALAAKVAEPVYQERRYQLTGNKQIEYWADINSSTYGYLPESERRLIYTTPQLNSPEIPEGWIKCSDHRPARGTDVQVYCSDTREQFVAFHIGNGEFQYAQHEDTSVTCNPSHWMPLPAAPEKPL